MNALTSKRIDELMIRVAEPLGREDIDDIRTALQELLQRRLDQQAAEFAAYSYADKLG